MSRARLGLYVFAKAQLFADCYELAPAMKLLMARPKAPALLPQEYYAVRAPCLNTRCMVLLVMHRLVHALDLNTALQ